jgi:hypothetical protein
MMIDSVFRGFADCRIDDPSDTRNLPGFETGVLGLTKSAIVWCAAPNSYALSVRPWCKPRHAASVWNSRPRLTIGAANDNQ